MRSQIQFEEVQTFPYELISQDKCKLYYTIAVQDVLVNKIRLTVRALGQVDAQAHTLTEDFNGRYVSLKGLASTLTANTNYEVVGKVGITTPGGYEWGPNSLPIIIRIEKIPQIGLLNNQWSQALNSLYLDNGVYKARSQVFDAWVEYDQTDNDILSQYRYKLFEHNRDTQEWEEKYIGGWKSSPSVPNVGGRIRVKTAPSGTFDIKYDYSHSQSQIVTIAKPTINGWNNSTTPENLGKIAFAIAEAFKEHTDLYPEVSADDPTVVTIRSKRPTIFVNFTTVGAQTNLEIENLIMPPITEQFTNLEKGKDYYFLLEMVSLRGLHTVYHSPEFIVDYGNEVEPIKGKMSFFNYKDGRVEIKVENLAVDSEYEEQLLDNDVLTLILCRTRKQNIENTTCISTNTQEVDLQRNLIEVGEIPLSTIQSKYKIDGVYHYPPIVFTDIVIENGAIYEYFLLVRSANLKTPVTVNGNVVNIKVLAGFKGNYIKDKDYSFRLILDFQMDTMIYNNANGYLEPLQQQYPIVSYGETHYRSSRVTARVLTAEQTKHTTPVTNQATENDFKVFFVDWLSNGKEKILQLADGQTMIIAIHGNPTFSKDKTYMDLIAFDWVEVAHFNSDNVKEFNFGNFEGYQRGKQTSKFFEI